MEQLMTIDDIKAHYPNEWVLVGNPVLDETSINVLSGIPIYHSADKKEVCYLGRDKTKDYSKIKLIYTGSIKHSRVITGIFNRVK
jgi:hypothetical protein